MNMIWIDFAHHCIPQQPLAVGRTTEQDRGQHRQARAKWHSCRSYKASLLSAVIERHRARS